MFKLNRNTFSASSATSQRTTNTIMAPKPPAGVLRKAISERASGLNQSDPGQSVLPLQQQQQQQQQQLKG